MLVADGGTERGKARVIGITVLLFSAYAGGMKRTRRPVSCLVNGEDGWKESEWQREREREK